MEWMVEELKQIKEAACQAITRGVKDYDNAVYLMFIIQTCDKMINVLTESLRIQNGEKILRKEESADA